MLNEKKIRDWFKTYEPEVNLDQFEATNDRAEKHDTDRNYEQLYNELIMAVERKWTNETRHETALRYIKEREQWEPTVKGADL